MHDHAQHAHGHISIFEGLFEWLLHEPLEGLGLPHDWTEAIVHLLGEFFDISLLLLVVVFVVCYIQTFIPYEKMRATLSKIRGLPGCALALLLGVASPFCSCSVIPIIIGFLGAGVPLTYCLVYLSAASCLNVTAVSTIFASFPLPFALAYVLCGGLTCVAAAYLTASFGAKKYVRIGKLHGEHEHHHEEKPVGRLQTALCGAGDVYKSVWLYLLVGVSISAAVSLLASETLLQGLLTNNPFALPLATVIGGALHSDVFSIMPIVQMVFSYSFPVALSLLLGTMLFSVAEWALLSKVFKTRLIAKYCLILLGFAFASGLVATALVGIG